jgi:acyl-CoA reductase-like NAD-dependent aldehyde dehydrogenase
MVPMVIRPLIAGEAIDSDDAVEVIGVDGSMLAEVRTAPKLLAQLAIRRTCAADVAPDVFSRAGKLFAEAELAGQDPEEYSRQAALASGVPVSVFAAGMVTLRAGLDELAAANAAESPLPVQGPGYAVRWLPKGRLLAVVAASNHPEPHLTWARALSLGYGVIVRPGGRDPFTAIRLAGALLAAGLPPASLAVLPSDHLAAEHLVKTVGRAVVYGGADAVSHWAGQAAVLVRGPGRSKALLDAPLSDAVLEHLAQAVSAGGGVRCANISVLRTSGDIAMVADRLADRLAAVAVRSVLHPLAALPAFDRARATALAATLARLRQAGLRDHSGDPLVRAQDGSYVARPVVLSTADRRHPMIGTELPFPFVAVAPWSPGDGLASLRESLVLNLIGVGEDLVERALREPSIRKVVVGLLPPWTTRAELPHDGSMASFLLEPKALLRAEEAGT